MFSKEKQDKSVKLIAKCTYQRVQCMVCTLCHVARIPVLSLQLFLMLKLLSTLMLFLSLFLAAGLGSLNFERRGMRETQNCLGKGSERTG